MPGPISLKTQKGLLTRCTNNLTQLINGYDSSPQSTWTPAEQRELGFKLNATARLLSETLMHFTRTLDELGDALSAEQEQQVDNYIEAANTVLEKAQTLFIEIKARHSSRADEGPAVTQTPVKLPAIPIPTFTGKIWEFSNFWTLFESNVHRQPLSKLQKFNYLISALRGEAQELIRRYPVTDANYDHAVRLLHDKYGNESTLIAHLQSRLEASKADSPSVQSQRRLLELLIPIVTQLEERGVHLNGSYLTQKILSKFNTSLQRKTLELCLPQYKQDNDWTLRNTLSVLDNLISTEEQINHMVEKNDNTAAYHPNTSPRASSQNIKPSSPQTRCMFCNSYRHRAADCEKLSTITNRRAFLQQNSRCLNCARQGHFLNECKSEGCRKCKGQRHHHTICPRLERFSNYPLTPNKVTQPREGINRPPSTRQTKHTSGTDGTTKQAQVTLRDRTQKRSTTQANPLHVCNDGAPVPDTDSTMQPATTILHNSGQEKGTNHVLLLTGVAKVQVQNQNTGKQTWREVEILFDTGADQSFISEALANDLGLKCDGEKQLLMYTFGSEKPIPTKCGFITLELWDTDGLSHSFQLYSTPILTEKGHWVQLTKPDLLFVKRHRIRLSKSPKKHVSKPDILLGCDQLWSLLETPLPRYTLPSGLQLIPSKLGYLLTGKQQLDGAVRTVKEIDTTCHIHVINTDKLSEEFKNDLIRWDKYWTIDSAGICEFTGTKNAEKEITNEKVAQFFDSTIQRRDDGYYVRLPYKDNHPPLPNDRNIAIKRLQGVLNMLQNDHKLGEEYSNTFRDQLEKGIIEMIPNNHPQDGETLYYIPHQPVITPHKATTKLRIVFDASSHYKGCPSLNDVLHQGPLVLPDLYAMLIRFRISQYVIISDVEKAFLQIRLQEVDRDATRFLWVKDPTAPLTDDNIITLRFTRVTFGLNVSPFLLAGTISYHLKHAVENDKLAEEILHNLYVDNLILSADNRVELMDKAVAARRIFSDMGMNLREFLSNALPMDNSIPQEAQAKSTEQKVLGINWDAEQDNLQLTTAIPPMDMITKRVVARQIASVYDPLGWMCPLLTLAKHFQQKLWKNGFEWDTPLPEETYTEWETIRQNMDGFSKTLPRRLPFGQANPRLAVFADASDIAMSGCAYLVNTTDSSLIMAKCKLPSIKSKTTMPKMEMNALTMAARLTWSIHRTLRAHTTTSQPQEVFPFSDSQIVLNWLAGSPKNSSLGVLVGNRLKEIRNIVAALNNEGVSVRFGYINTKDNPADAGTRGLTQKELLRHSLWWNGPAFLRTAEAEWPVIFFHHSIPETAIPEIEHTVNAIHKVEHVVNAVSKQINEENDFIDLRRFSSFSKAKRVLARMLIFLVKLLRPLTESSKERIFEKIPALRSVSRQGTPLRAKDVLTGKFVLIYQLQKTQLTKEYRKSMENSLRLFKDTDNTWRSRGRLARSTLSIEAKSPIFIAPNTELARLIIDEGHGMYHRGIENTIATIRQNYWIPKLRQQVRKLIHKCVKCRRFNALPYEYPETTDLPQRRVCRSQPFQHVGIDFFDLPTTSDNEATQKRYGCIFTCTVTRLIHLEVLQSMNTTDFINALRRFVARRGKPESITCDNAPTFLLTSSILSGSIDGSTLNSNIEDFLANEEIQLRHITSYAPWQGGFYERLIKSVKHALYKALRGATHRTGDHLHTIITEIESCLNSRPLTYQGTEHEVFNSVRPADFIHQELNLTLPLNAITIPPDNDPEYLPLEEVRALQTRKGIIDALKSSCETTERFWKIWHEHYLTGLREHHKKYINDCRYGKEVPDVGHLVLVNEPVLPRNDWRLARITEVHRSNDGNIREVELVTATRRKIRRPVNLITPLVIDAETEPFDTKSDPPPDSDIPARGRYHLRPRKTRTDMEHNVTSVSTWRPKSCAPRWFLFYLMILSLFQTTPAETRIQLGMTCTPAGVAIHAAENQTVELCTDKGCTLYSPKQNPFMVKLPPQVTLHDHRVILKWLSGEKLVVVETTCKRLDFCAQLDCGLCMTVLLNPECWPLGAITVLAVLTYVIVALLYTFLYVPVTMGKPAQILAKGAKGLLILLMRLVICLCKRILGQITRNRTRTQMERLTAALAINFSLVLLSRCVGDACQHVELLQHQTTFCTRTGDNESCTIALSNLLKLNTFKQEACLRLTTNLTQLITVRVRWKGFYLRCNKEIAYYTRAVTIHSVYSKRCPHMGSCVGKKCAAINNTSLLEELSKGNVTQEEQDVLNPVVDLAVTAFIPARDVYFIEFTQSPKIPKHMKCSIAHNGLKK